MIDSNAGSIAKVLPAFFYAETILRSAFWRKRFCLEIIALKARLYPLVFAIDQKEMLTSALPLDIIRVHKFIRLIDRNS